LDKGEGSGKLGIMTDVDILIAGGGPVGMAAALALAAPARRSGLRLMLVNAQAIDDIGKPQTDGRAYNLSASSMRMLSALGVWETLEDRVQPITKIIVTDGANDKPRPALLDFDNFDTSDAGQGSPASYIVEAEHLNAALAKTVLETKIIETRSPDVVESAAPQNAYLSADLASGDKLRTRLLIVADGRASPLREQLGVHTLTWPHGQSAIVMAVRHEKNHEGRAFEHFRAPGPFAVLPLKGGYRSSLVWNESPQEAKRIMALNAAEFLNKLRRRFGDELGEVSADGKAFSYPLTSLLAHEYIGPRFALIGDAAHGIHPIAGQGVNLGYRGVAALAQVIDEAMSLGLDIGALDVLEGYQRRRRFDALTLVAGCAALNELFANSNPALRRVRDMGLGMVNRLPSLKRLFVSEAAGSTGDLPRLMRGGEGRS